MKKLALIVLVLSLSVLLFACNASQTDFSTEATESQTTTVAESQSQTEVTVKDGYSEGFRAIDFELKDADGNLIKLSDYRGKTVVLNFFASWCGPCQAETPHLNEVYNELKDSDVVVLSVNLTTSQNGEKESALKFIEDYQVDFPVVFDETGSVASSYRVRSIPTNIFIRPDGTINLVLLGAMEKEDFIKNINDAAKAGE